MCLLNGVSKLQLTLLDLMDPHHPPEEAWSLGHQEAKVAALAINQERWSSRQHLSFIHSPLQDYLSVQASWLSKELQNLQRSFVFAMVPTEFLDWGREGKSFVVKKKVKEGVCKGIMLHWLEWDCPEESRSVMGIQTVPGEKGSPDMARLEKHFEMKSAAVSSLWLLRLQKTGSLGEWSAWRVQECLLKEWNFHWNC